MIRVLIVDDELIVRIALKSMIEWDKTEFQIVDAVSDGQAALTAIKQYQPQIIITDLKMPNMDGLELAKRLWEEGYRGKIIVLSSYGKFEYAKEALYYGVVGYLLKASFDGKELLAALRHAAKFLPHDVMEPSSQKNSVEFSQTNIYNLLYNNTSPEIKNYDKRYLAVYLYLKDIFSKIKNVASDNSQNILSSLTSECVNSHNNVTVIPLTGQDSILLYPLTSFSSNISEIILRDCHKIANFVQIYMNTQIGFILSDSFSCESELQNNLHECIQASNLSLYFGYGRLLKQDKSKEYSNSLNKDSLATVEKICVSLTKSDYDTSKQTALNVLDSFAPKYISVNEAQQYIKTLFEHITIQYCFYLENDMKRINKFTIRYEKCSTTKEYKMLFIEIIDEISVSLIKIDETQYRHEVMDIITFIKKNLDKKITLSKLTNAVNMSESYISRLFKNETSTNLMSYVNMLKMERAMELLKDPNIYVKQAAIALGYDDQSYFNRIFNKYLGISPKEFKHHYQSTTENLKH